MSSATSTREYLEGIVAMAMLQEIADREERERERERERENDRESEGER